MGTRTERVILDLEDRFTTKMAKAAAQTILMKKAVDDLDGSAIGAQSSTEGLGKETDGLGASQKRTTKTTKEFTLEVALAEERSRRLRTELREQAKAQLDLAAGTGIFRDEVRSTGPEIDRMSGRLRLLADAAITMGPALVPLGAAAVGTLPALAVGFGAVAGGIGVTVLAMQGLGDATKALNEAALSPTTENLAKARDELARIGPAAADFAIYLQRIKPQLLDIQNLARAGLFPGMQESIDNLLTRAPQVEAIVGDLSRAVGDLIAEAGAGIGGPAFDGFFEYLEREAGPILMSVGRSIGNVATGIANMLVGFAPVTRDFTGGLERMTRSFAEWSQGLENNAGFQQFVSYIRESGPQAIALLGGLVKAVAGLAQAAAPLGSTLLPVLTQLVEAFAAVASSPIGGPLLTAAAAMTVVSRATSAAEIAMTRFGDSSTKAGTALATSLKAGAAIAGITLVSQGVTELNSALDELNLDRNLQALSLGAPVEDLDNMALAIERVSSGLRAGQEPLLELTSGFGLLGDTTLDGAQDGVKQLDQSLAQMVESGRADQAAAAFERLMAAAVDRGVDVDEARSQFTAYATALDNVAASAPPAADASKGLANAWRSTAAAARQEASAIRDSIDAMLEKKNATIGAFDAETNYRQALKAAREQAEKNNAGLRGSSDAALANRSAISALAGAWNGQTAAVRNNIGRFKEARANFIQTAQAMGVPKQAAIELAEKLLAIPKSRVTEVRAETKAALSAIQGIKSQLDSIPRSIRTDYYVNQVNSISRRANVPLPGEYAEGGFTGPGGKYEPAGIVHRGEVVIPQDRVQRDWPMLKARYGDLPGFASGGFVTQPYARSYDNLSPAARLAEDVARGMEMFGDTMRDAERNVRSELTARARLLEKEQEATSKRLDALRQERDAIESSVRSRLTSDLFQQRDRITLDRPENFDQWDPAKQRDFLMLEQSLNRSASPLDTLRGDIERAREEGRLIQQLKARGLDGAALSQVIQGGNLSAAADLSAQELRQFERLYNRREQVVTRTADTASTVVVGKAIDRLANEQREDRRELKQVNRQLEALRKEVRNGAKDAGEQFGRQVNSAMTNGQRRRV